MAIRIYQVYSQVAEVVHIVQPEYILVFLFRLALKSHIVRRVTQYRIHLLRYFISGTSLV